MRSALLALALFATVPPAGAAEIVELAEAPVVLTAPVAGTDLPGGSWFELAWAPAARFSELQSAEEWELFLSLDGGRSFPVRLTPHLDLELRHISFEVPNLPSDDVRLLFRYGDELREHAFRLPGRFRIHPGRIASLEEGSTLRLPGEPALSGAAGVASWSDGARDGSGRTQRSAGLRRPAVSGRPTIEAYRTSELRGEEGAAKQLPPPAPGALSFTRNAAVGRSRSGAGAAPRNADLLRLLRRQNE